MQPSTEMIKALREFASGDPVLFALSDLQALLPVHTENAFKSIVSRLVKRGELDRICRGIYTLPGHAARLADPLARVAARLRAHQFNYISLESALSDAGVISQVPVNRLTLMSSGRTSIIHCGVHGTVEFVHTRKNAGEVAEQLVYDPVLKLWRASVALALRDMRDTRRDTGLIDKEAADEFV